MLIWILPLTFFAAQSEGAACVWKVTSPAGELMYLGGSIHYLRASDYPLPHEYDDAFKASSRLAFETDLTWDNQSLVLKNAQYPKGDSLKNHVDPRTYDYVRRVFALLNVPEAKFAKYRPWFLVEALTSPVRKIIAPEAGVEQYLAKKGRAAGKKIEALTPLEEHLAVMSGLSDKQGEILLLSTFIPMKNGEKLGDEIMKAWRRGDADTIAKYTHASMSSFPSFEDRILGARNHAWVPKIEKYLRSGNVYFVVVGSAHLGGNDGLLALLGSRGYKLEQA